MKITHRKLNISNISVVIDLILTKLWLFWSKIIFIQRFLCTKNHFGQKKFGYKNFESKKFCTKNLFLDQHFFIQNIFLTKNVFGTKVIFGSNYFYDEILNLLINLIKSYLILTYCSNKIKTNFNGFWHNWNKPNFHLALRASGTVLRQVQGDILDKEIFY